MPSSMRVVDVLLLLLVSQTTQAGPLRRVEKFYQRDWNTTSSVTNSADVASSIPSDPAEISSAIPNPVTAQKEQDDGSTPSPIFVTIDDTTRDTPVATQTGGQSPSAPVESSLATKPLTTTTEAAATLPPMFSTISLPPHATSAARNESSLAPEPTTAAPAPGEGDASSQTVPLQSSLSFAFPVPGETTATPTTTLTEQPAASPPTSAPTTTVATQTPTDTPSAVTTTAPFFRTTPPSATVEVTGTPNNQVPTVNTSVPAATATVSPEVAAANLANAKSFNALFASLTEKSACTPGGIACIAGDRAICGANGAFEISEKCGSAQECFALPMNTTEGVMVRCHDPVAARKILGESAPAPGPGSPATTPAQSPPASEVVSEITTTVTPTVTATSIITVTPPGGNPNTTPAVPVATETSTVLVAPPERTSTPGFTTTIFVTRTLEPDPKSTATTETTTTTEPTTTTKTTRQDSSTTTTEVESTPTTFTTRRRTRTTTETPAPTTTADTLILDPIPSTVPTVPVAKVTAGPGALTVTVTEKETETVTVTQTEKEVITIVVPGAEPRKTG